jgi:hypothetical protein
MKLLNTNRYYLKGTSNRFIHIATIANGVREFVAFFDSIGKQLFIEEISGGSLEFISDDSLAKELSDFLFYKEITNLRHGDFTVDNI